jgi:hypothetical protein
MAVIHGHKAQAFLRLCSSREVERVENHSSILLIGSLALSPVAAQHRNQAHHVGRLLSVVCELVHIHQPSQAGSRTKAPLPTFEWLSKRLRGFSGEVMLGPLMPLLPTCELLTLEAQTSANTHSLLWSGLEPRR